MGNGDKQVSWWFRPSKLPSAPPWWFICLFAAGYHCIFTQVWWAILLCFACIPIFWALGKLQRWFWNNAFGGRYSDEEFQRLYREKARRKRWQ